VRVIVPVVILDELDGLKGSGDARRRWRAGYTLAVMEEAFAAKPVPGLLRGPAGNRGGVILDLLLDPPGHVRLPINDDEIIDRTLAAQALAGTPVTLLTFDTSEAERGRRAGLRVNKLTVPIGEEPPDTRNRKANRAPATS
jgi:PIN domain